MATLRAPKWSPFRGPFRHQGKADEGHSATGYRLQCGAGYPEASMPDEPTTEIIRWQATVQCGSPEGIDARWPNVRKAPAAQHWRLVHRGILSMATSQTPSPEVTDPDVPTASQKSLYRLHHPLGRRRLWSTWYRTIHRRGVRAKARKFKK